MGKTENPTNDLSKFGMRELRLAGKLLVEYAEGQPDFLGEGVQVWFNMESGNVFLCDSEYNVAMFNDDNWLEQFVSCCECGAEGFIGEWISNMGDKPCGHGESERGF